MDIENKNELIKKNSAELRIKPEIYEKIVKTAISENDSAIADIEAFADNNDLDSIAPLAHKIKGVFLNLKILSIGNPSQEIDRICKEKGSIEDIKKHFKLLKEEFGLVKKDFE